MKRTLLTVWLASAGLISTAHALDTDAVVGGALGGAAGAAVGSAVGGREGAVIGAGLGGAAGAAIATQDRPKRVKKEVVYVEKRHDNGLHLGHYKHKRKHRHDWDD
ncbi:glycine zipper domain-containing protein [Thiobacter aerophilum]|uniref:Glycine zipper domain-containing protein n=1 Tax=Thiobacter aerophilum TaxID=3121275 RepID=A0ABV0EDR8_9BURK